MNATDAVLLKMLQNSDVEKALRPLMLSIAELLERMEKNGQPVPTDLGPLIQAIRETQPAVSLAPQMCLNAELVTPPGAAWRVEGRDSGDRPVSIDRAFSWVVTKLGQE